MFNRRSHPAHTSTTHLSRAGEEHVAARTHPRSTRILALQRSAGNAAVSRMLSRTPIAPHEFAGFSKDELRWIDEVWALEEIQLLFGANPSIPQVVMERVAEISGTDPEGRTDDGEHVLMADAAYAAQRAWNPEGIGEIEFKSTLIHELFHVRRVRRTGTRGRCRASSAPLKLVAWLTYPEREQPRAWRRTRSAGSPIRASRRPVLLPAGTSWSACMSEHRRSTRTTRCTRMLEDTRERGSASPDRPRPGGGHGDEPRHVPDQPGGPRSPQGATSRCATSLIQEYFQTVKVQTEKAAGVPSVPTP